MKSEHSLQNCLNRRRRAPAPIGLTFALTVVLAGIVVPVVEAAEDKLTANDGVANDFLGWSSAISGNTVVVSARSDFFTTKPGSAYVFVGTSAGWTQQQKLTGSDVVGGDQFGSDVTISGDTVIIGSPRDDVANVDQGSAYVFVRNGNVWTQQQKLVANDAGPSKGFGYSVAISGDTLVLSSTGDEGSRGSAYVFERSGGIWTQQQKLTASDGIPLDAFGISVAISGDTIVVGATSDDVGRGSAYVYVRSGGVWTQQQKLIASDRAPGDVFGSSTSISGDNIVVSSPFDDVGANVNQGSAYVFVRNGSVWTQQQKLSVGDGADQFGNSVAVLGNTILVGSPGDDVAANTFQGSAYVFMRSGGIWTQQHQLTASDGVASDFLGYSVALNQDFFVAGALGDDGLRGSAYVFSTTPEEELEEVVEELEDIVNDNSGTPLADKVEDALAKVRAALAKLEAGDRLGALGELEGAVDDIQAAVNDGLLSAEDGNELNDRIAGAARRIAEVTIEQAEAAGADPAKIAEARAALAEGDAKRAAGQYKDAIAKYKDAASKAEGA